MTLDEKAKIVALARLLGVAGSDKEIFDKYWEYYQDAKENLAKTETTPQAKACRRPL